MTLPPAPNVPIDRISLGAMQWTALLHGRAPTFAAECSRIASKFDGEQARAEAARVLRVAQAHGAMNGRELITALDIVKTWPDQEPGARMAVCIALAEIGGGTPIDNDVARVLSAERWR